MQGGRDGYVFSFDEGVQHYPENQILPRFYHALDKMGISEEMRKKRPLKFHSRRHAFNTLLLANEVNTIIAQSVIGHESNRMTKNYTHFRLENYKDVVNVQNQLYRGSSV